MNVDSKEFEGDRDLSEALTEDTVTNRNVLPGQMVTTALNLSCFSGKKAA